MSNKAVEDRANYYVLPELGWTEAIAATFRRRRFRPHYHEAFLIGVTESGAEVFDARGGRHVSPQGSLRLLNPGEVHTGEPPEGGVWMYRCLYPSENLLREIAAEVGFRGTPWFSELIVPDTARAAELLAAFSSIDRAATRLERSTRFRVALARIVAAHAGRRPTSLRTKKPESRAVGVAQALIADRWAEDFTLDELAREAGMSPFHLVRVFKARCGITPFAYQTQLRVAQARRWLALGRGVEETAAACGFCDRSHLGRAFRGLVGVTPAAYRRAVWHGIL